MPQLCDSLMIYVKRGFGGVKLFPDSMPLYIHSFKIYGDPETLTSQNVWEKWCRNWHIYIYIYTYVYGLYLVNRQINSSCWNWDTGLQRSSKTSSVMCVWCDSRCICNDPWPLHQRRRRRPAACFWCCSWLLADRNMKVRSNYSGYRDAVSRFFTDLLPRIGHLQVPVTQPFCPSRIVALQCYLVAMATSSVILNQVIFFIRMCSNLPQYFCSTVYRSPNRGSGGNIPAFLGYFL